MKSIYQALSELATQRAEIRGFINQVTSKENVMPKRIAPQESDIVVAPPKPGEPGYLRSLDQERKPETENVALVRHPAELSHDQVELLKRTICHGATDDELKLFVQVCNRTSLDPFTKQIFAIKRWDSKAKREVMGIQCGIDGFRTIASRTGLYEGQTEAQWCGEDGTWVNVWLKPTPPSAARIGVWRRGFREPCYAVALWTGYAQKDKEGNVTKFWKQMGSLMLSKVAEALALRKAFPFELSGLYTGDEMAQASKPESGAVTHLHDGDPEMSAIDAEVVSGPAMRSEKPELVRPQKKASKLAMQPVSKPESTQAEPESEPAGERPAFEGMPKEIVADEKSGQVLPANFDKAKVYNIETCPASAPRITREAAMALYGAAKEAGMPDYKTNVGFLITLKTGFSRPGEVPAFGTYEKLLAYFKSGNWAKDISK